jgi:4-alpha-glucanotransferase
VKLARSSGVLLHLTSLPSPWGVGDLGPWAHRTVDLMAQARQSLWQILPLTPVGGLGSPYSAHSLFAGNPLLLSPEGLVQEGFLSSVPDVAPPGDPTRVDYPSSLRFKDGLVEKAYGFSYGRTKNEQAYTEFCAENFEWLDDFALYDALAREYAGPWVGWPEGVRRREKPALADKRAKLLPFIEKAKFAQYLFQRQWSSLKSHARLEGISILGDVPFYVLHESSDLWAHPELFKVGVDGRPLYVGGVPPDYFSKTGQRWGNPVYDWARMEQEGYRWWKRRVSRDLALTDFLRLDHFRGYVAYWEIPAGAPTAETGEWVPLPTTFLDEVRGAFPALPFVAEDLGVITDDVRAAIARLGIPGMRVLQFAFDGSQDNPHLPPNYEKNSLVYTGTHDTNTTVGWFANEATTESKAALEKYLGRPVTPQTISMDFVEMAMGSVADLCVTPMQDLLGLGGEARMNDPATTIGNWGWRATPEELSEASFQRLLELTRSNGRG